MRLGVIRCLLLLAACAQPPAASQVEQNTRPVVVVPDTQPVFPALPTAPAGSIGPTLASPQLTGAPRAKAIPLLVWPTLTTEPPSVTLLSELREVRVRLDVSGADPSELTVEFTAPSGQLFDRQVTQLTGSRYDAQSGEFVLPVAGTLIQSQQMVGTWQALFFLKGIQQANVSFEVTQ